MCTSIAQRSTSVYNMNYTKYFMSYFIAIKVREVKKHTAAKYSLFWPLVETPWTYAVYRYICVHFETAN